LVNRPVKSIKREKKKSTYTSVKLTNLPSSAGKFPVNAFEEKTLEINDIKVNFSI